MRWTLLAHGSQPYRRLTGLGDHDVLARLGARDQSRQLGLGLVHIHHRRDQGQPSGQARSFGAGWPVLRWATEQVDVWLPLLDELPHDKDRRDELSPIAHQRRQRLTP